MTRGRSPDRVDQIVAAALGLFSQHGYHAVSMNDIGRAVGLDRSSLYFHFPSKDAVLAEVGRTLLNSYTELLGDIKSRHSTGEARLVAFLEESVRMCIQQRHYLIATPADLVHYPPEVARELRHEWDATGKLNVDALIEANPALTAAEAHFMVTAVGGIPTSLVNHSPRMARQRLIDLLVGMSKAALFLEPAPRKGQVSNVQLAHADPTRTPESRKFSRSLSSSRERVLRAAARLFRRNGYEGVGVEAVAQACGVTANALYSHFESKDALLSAILTRASDLIMITTERAFAEASDAHDALTRLIDGYLQLTVHDKDILTVYWMQVRAVSRDSQLLIMRERRAFVRDWESVISDVRGIESLPARTMAYAVLGLLNANHSSRELSAEDRSAILRSMALNSILNSPSA
ncbi:TetR/AcrR family transcriptional regulator [Nocardia sp. NPDC051990]|uniref:TetR/AcrR family transcriptional regulator n=1 Tax=Nocardia sp. NPDC051990 TaxID=3155285 RepID=UPI00341CAB26